MRSRIFYVLFTIAVFAQFRTEAQISSFDELEIEEESISTAYQPSGGHVYLRSRRGTSGMPKAPEADAIVNAKVTQIVLVFTELNAADEEEREDANRERWDNLIMTYPQLFQENTTYKGVCQCNAAGDSEAFKKVQGFYIYYKGAPRTEAAPTPVEKAPEPVAAKEPARKVAEAVPDKTSAPPPLETKPAEPVRSEPAKSEPVSPANTAKEAIATDNPPAPARKEAEPVTEAAEEEEAAPAPVVKKKPAATNKPRRTRDPKACRPACYQGGDDDLNTYFRENLTLTKKQRRKAKNAVVNVRLQVHFDGTIKKVSVTGNNELLNKMVQDAVGGMNNWNPSVKNGVTIKSDVRMTLKYDKESKTLKPTDVITNPKTTPKCRCVSDSELFD
jgi:hypothetical protein